MKLVRARVQNFRSAEDSGEFSLEQMTCLIGKNEAGKTAILQALAGLKPNSATPFEFAKERDYPKRYLARYNERHDGDDAVVVTTYWELAPGDVAQLTALVGEESLTGTEVKISRGYNSGLTIAIPIDHQKAVENAIKKCGFSAPENSQLNGVTDSRQLMKRLEELPDGGTEKQKRLKARFEAFPSKSIWAKAWSILNTRMPTFMYFSNYDLMSAAVHLETLRDQIDSNELYEDEELRGDRLFVEFLEFAGVTVEEVLQAKTFESFNANLQAASNTLTQEILDYWSQKSDIEARVNVAFGLPDDPPPLNSGKVGRARIYDTLHRAETAFSERSAGFTWFFSFLIKFEYVKRSAEGGVILLLDEPGLTLHGLAQADLLRYFEEKLLGDHQIIYSTHSPFMVPPNNLLSSRIVEDIVDVNERGRRTPRGTTVREDVLEADRDSIFPLQGALGYSITQTLFVGENTLLVEGPSDILYVQALSAELDRRGRTHLDPKWVLCPSGGIDRIQAFLSLFGANGLAMATFTDYAKRDRQRLGEIKQSAHVQEGGVLTVADFVEQSEADIEDLLDPELFCQIVNSTYALSPKHALTPVKLAEAKPNTERLVKKAEAAFMVMPEEVPDFDHFAPAAWLLKNPDALEGEADSVTSTLDRAEKVFETLNAVIRS